MRVLCIGQGQRLAATRALAHDLGIAEVCLFPGAVPQTEVPAYLAACDVLVAAQQPDPDGSRFFCSPMKIFEYMAMGRGIVSTRLEQAGQILEQGKTALLTHPRRHARSCTGDRRASGGPGALPLHGRCRACARGAAPHLGDACATHYRGTGAPGIVNGSCVSTRAAFQKQLFSICNYHVYKGKILVAGSLPYRGTCRDPAGGVRRPSAGNCSRRRSCPNGRRKRNSPAFTWPRTRASTNSRAWT